MKLKIISQIAEGIANYFSQRLHISLILIISFLLVIFTILVFIQVGRRQFVPMGWVRIGCDDNNTNFFRCRTSPQTQYQSRSGPKKSRSLIQGKQNLISVWNAEEFCPQPFRLVGGIHKVNYNLRTCDLNKDGKLEIIVNFHGQAIILNAQGIFQYSIPHGFDVYVDEDKNIHSIACSLNMIRYSLNGNKDQYIRTLEPVITAMITKLRDYEDSKVEILTVEKINATDETNQFQISCYDSETKQPRWSYQFNNLTFIAAIGDINQDNRNEIICTSFIPAKTFGVVTALSSSGRFIWQSEFSMQNKFSNFYSKVASYTDAAIADLDGDGKTEVVAIFGTEDGSLGRLSIIDGKTGEIIEQYPKDRFLRRAFSSLGIADLDHDGNPDLVATTRGVSARLYSFRLGSSGLETLATRRYFPLTIREAGIVTTWVWALADVDADNEVEILSSIVYEMPLYSDWAIRTTRFLEPSIIVLDSKFKEKYYIDLEERCLGMIVSGITRNSSCEILVLADRLYLYAIQ